MQQETAKGNLCCFLLWQFSPSPA